MTFETLADTSGREPFEWIEIGIDRCSLTYGLSPCPASLEVSGDGKCFNSWRTCPTAARTAFDPATYWIRLCQPRAYIPLNFTFSDDGMPFFLPFLDRTRHSPGQVDVGRNLGVRSSLRVQLTDAPHHDRDLDKYVDERSYNAIDRGLFLQNLKARWPYLTGRTLRWYRGYLPEDETTAAATDFKRRDYVIEAFDGPDERGAVSITAKDPLRLVDDDRAQDPKPTTGVLAFDLAETGTPTSIRISLSSVDDYSQYPDEAGYVAINGEVIRYASRAEGLVDNIPTVTLSDISRLDLPAGYVTERQAHEAGDVVQRCVYRSGRVIDIVQDLLLEVPGFDASWIPFSEWDTEYQTWMGGFTIARLICEPEGIRSIIDEIIEETMTWGFWWCERCNDVKFRAIRPADIDEVVPLLTDGTSLINGRFKIRERPDDLINELQILYAQRNPLTDKEDVDNYSRGVVAISTTSQSANEIGARRSRKIYSRWHRSGARARVQQFSTRTLNQTSQVPVQLTFEVGDKDALDTADFADLSTIYLRSIIDWSTLKRVQVTRVTRGDGVLSIDALEDFFRGRFARIAPASPAPLEWADADTDTRARYVFIANANGLMSDGETGTQLL